jgi:UDP-N-acetylmuramate dehydrogenase
VLAMPKTVEDLHLLAEGLRTTGIPPFVMGAGSNLLVSDSGFDGLVVRCSRMNLDVFAMAPDRLRTGGSVAVSSLLRRAATEGWGGLEFLSGIPGSIGGVVAMNAGTHLGEACEKLRLVEVYPLSGAWAGEAFEPLKFSGDQLKFAYRRNFFLPPNSIVWAAEWEIRSEAPVVVKKVIDETLARRKATQPIDYPSCGSVFKNPRESGMSAWQVVDKLGLRGHRIGDAQFAEKHSNFIINLGSAKAADVKGLIELAKSRAAAELGVKLEEEVMFLSSPSAI